MSNYKYLDDNGLIYYHSKVKALLNNKVDKVTGKGLSTNDYTTTEKDKLSGIASGAEVNQNAYGKVTIGGSTYNAMAKQDKIEFVGGTGINISGDTSSNHIKISFDCDAEIPTKTSDLTNDSGFITNSDIATSSTPGLVKISDNYGIAINGSGTVFGADKTYSQYSSGENNIIISKGTLENIITGKELVSSTDYATGSKGGAVKVNTNYGLSIDSGTIKGNPTTNETTYGNTDNKFIICKGTAEAFYERKSNKVTSMTSSSTDTQYPSAKCVYDTIQDAIGSITGLSFEIVQTLPTTGVAGVIYLVPNSGTAPNIYDEYIWISSTSKFEKIGTTDVDLSGYVQSSEMVTITNAEIDTIVA